MDNKITKTKIDKYRKLTTKALREVKKNIVNGKTKEAKEIIEMVTNYLGDSRYFFEREDYVNTFAALNYAHGWIDAGVRLGIFDVHDNKLFTIK